MRDRLKKMLGNHPLLLGVGNTARGDDGVGSLLVRKLTGRIEPCCIDAGIAPENFLEKIVRKKPDTVLIVDAADFGGSPGEIRILEPGQLTSGGLSTHALSLRMACDYLQLSIPVEVHLLAIQPAQTNSEGLSSPVQASLDLLTNLFLELLPKAGKKIARPASGK
ncbi:MAG: hydrogenase 3 maturation endopeptidase HyCI [Candidatus Latescibacteria bacterium]|nr:hydrogenase 3 maturation endopeptidase HyCI [Candidatus Latescibacterota bacterium]